MSAAAGLALVLVGAILSGYGQSIALQLGSTLLLIAPLVVIQRILADEFLQRTVDEAEDRIASSLAIADEDVSPVEILVTTNEALSASSRESYIQFVMQALNSYSDVVESGDDSYVQITLGGTPARVIVKYLRSPVPSVIATEAIAIAEQSGIPVLLITNNRLTNSASQLIARHRHPPVMHLVLTPGDGNELLAEKLNDLRSRHDS